jgi:molecular chaperone GrpE
MTQEDLKDHIPTDTDVPEEEAAEATATEQEIEAPDYEQRIETLTQQLAEIEAKLDEAEAQAAEYLDGWKRAQASFANFRKRTESEQAQWRSAANAQLLSRLLPVLDDFKRAFDAIPEEDQDNPWLSGIRLVQRKISSILESENVQPIEVAPHDTFDPNFHEAVLYQEVEGFDEGEIVAEVETGYLLEKRILRPSVVVVAKGSPKSDKVEDAAAAPPEPTPEKADNGADDNDEAEAEA